MSFVSIHPSGKMDVTNWNNRNRIVGSFRKSRPDPIDEYLVNVGRKVEVFDEAGVESLLVLEIVDDSGMFDGYLICVVSFSLDVPELMFTLVGKHFLLAHFLVVFSGMRIENDGGKGLPVFIPIIPPWFGFVGTWSMAYVSFPGNIAGSVPARNVDVEIWIFCAFVFAGLDVDEMMFSCSFYSVRFFLLISCTDMLLVPCPGFFDTSTHVPP